MFEGYTLEAQRKVELERGWKQTGSALTYCTAEAVLFRKPEGARSVLDFEILEAERVTGAPDCVGKRQGKWGTYVNPKDPTARHSLQRGLKEIFDWDVPTTQLRFVGIVGPWLHKATAKLIGPGLLRLLVMEDQAEKTPFEAKLFCADATNYRLGVEGSYLRSTRDQCWVTIRNLIEVQGQNPDYLYWVMIALCAASQSGSIVIDPLVYLPPGEYNFRLIS